MTLRFDVQPGDRALAGELFRALSEQHAADGIVPGHGIQQAQRLLAAPHELPLELRQDDISSQHPVCQGFQPRHPGFRVLNRTKLSRQADHTIPFQSVTRILGTDTDNDLLLHAAVRRQSAECGKCSTRD